MTDAPTTAANPLLNGVRLSDMTDRLYSFGEIAEEIGGEADTLRSWFLNGGLALLHGVDEVADKGGRSHRLHWRTVVLLLMALKLNDYGFGKKTGEAAMVAGGAFKAGLLIEHFETTTDSPMIAVSRERDGSPRVFLADREAFASECEAPAILDGFEGIGTLLLDPVGFGRIVWRLGWRQVQAEAAAEGMAMTFSAEEIEAAEEYHRRHGEGFVPATGGVIAGKGPFLVGEQPGGETVIPADRKP